MDGIEGIYVALDKDRLWDFVNTAVKIWLHTVGAI